LDSEFGNGRKRKLITVSEFSLLHTAFRCIVEKELGHPIPIPQDVREAAGGRGPSPDQPAPESCVRWLALLDLAVNAHKLRGYVSAEDPEEPTLLALLRFLVLKKPHSETDRDKVDWLFTHLFRKREERSGLPTGWPKKEIQEILAGIEFPPLGRKTMEQLTEVPALLDEIKYYESFHQITDSRAVERGRTVKNQFEENFFHPDVLAAIVNYNLLLGKKFYGLVQEVSQKVHESAQSGQEEGAAPDTNELLQGDYRSSSIAFRDLGEIDRNESPPPTSPAPPAPANSSSPPTQPAGLPALDLQLKELGVSTQNESMHLRNRVQELSVRFRSSLQTMTVPNSVPPLHLHEWEAGAFRAQYPEAEETFRAQFARAICRGIAIISRIYEEIPLYLEKKGTEFHWKKHYDALVFLLYEGQKHKEALLNLSESSQQRGLREKAKQLQVTAEKLEACLEKAAAIF
jgi:hypothetical protein